MEVFAIMFAMPAAFIATAIYAQLMTPLLAHRTIGRIALPLSHAVLVGLFIEWGVLASIGPVAAQTHIGPAFYALHTFLFFLAIPALANILIIRREAAPDHASAARRTLSAWLIPLSAALLAFPVVVTQYGVAEALFGIDGQGGPFGPAPTIPMPSWW